MHVCDSAILRPPAADRLRGLPTVLFLGVTAGVQMSDRGLQAVLLPAVKVTFGASDTALGALQGIAGVLLASALAVPLARLADTHSRRRLLLGVIAAWGLLTAGSALAPGFPLFFAGRALVGVAEFAMIPIVYSLIPDLVEERWRLPSNLLFAALMAMGASAGFYFGADALRLAAGFGTDLLPAGTEAWRRAMLLLGLCGAPLLLAGLLVPDPARGGTAPDAAAPASLSAFVRTNRRAILLFVGTAGGLALAVQAVTPMIALALDRRFALDLDAIGHRLGLITLVTSLGCLPVAGALDRMLQRRFGTRARPLIMAGMAAAAIPCAALLGPAGRAGPAFAMVTLFLFLTSTANALIPTTLQDLTPPALRSRCFALYSFTVSVFCAAGPVLSGGFSDRLFAGDLLSAIAAAALPSLCLAIACALLLVTARDALPESRRAG